MSVDREATPLRLLVQEDEGALLRVLREVHRLLTRHPRVTAAVVSAFAAEGRAFATTAEGRRLRTALLGSERLRRARLLWNALGLEAHAARPVAFKPGLFLGLLIAATGSTRLEELLSRLLMDELEVSE